MMTGQEYTTWRALREGAWNVKKPAGARFLHPGWLLLYRIETSLLFKSTNVLHQIVDLVWRQLPFVGGHRFFPLRDGAVQVCIRHGLHVGPTQVFHFHAFAHGGITFSVGAMTSRTLCFENVGGGIGRERPGRKRA